MILRRVAKRWRRVGDLCVHSSGRCEQDHETSSLQKYTQLVFYRATLCVSAVFAVARCLSVYLSVRLSVSVTFVHSIQTAEDIVKLLCRSGSPIILVFLTYDADTQFQGEPLQQGRKIQGGRKSLRFSTEIAVCLGNGTRWAHGCYGTLIGSYMRSIE